MHLYGTLPLLYRIVSVCTAFYFTLGWWVIYRNKEPLYILGAGLVCALIGTYTENNIYAIAHTLWHLSAYIALYSIGRGIESSRP